VFKVLYQYEEKTGEEVPLDEFEAGLLQLAKACAAK
jgi:hypothetical protein